MRYFALFCSCSLCVIGSFTGLFIWEISLILDESVRQQIEAAVGHVFGDPSLIACALTHSSFVSQRTQSNERLELLGDSVLSLVICEHLYARYPDANEGELTKIKSYLVSRLKCAEYANEAGFVPLMVLGKGFAGSAIPSSIAGSVFEALIAAVYLDGGMECARRFILRFVEPHVDLTERMGHQMNFKSVLQQVAQSMEAGTPTYVVIDQKGPDHAKAFEICVEVGHRRFPSCWGTNKKSAEQAAALLALRALGFADGEEPHVRITWGIALANQRKVSDATAPETIAGSADPSTSASAKAE